MSALVSSVVPDRKGCVVKSCIVTSSKYKSSRWFIQIRNVYITATKLFLGLLCHSGIMKRVLKPIFWHYLPCCLCHRSEMFKTFQPQNPTLNFSVILKALTNQGCCPVLKVLDLSRKRRENIQASRKGSAVETHLYAVKSNDSYLQSKQNIFITETC